MSDTEGFCPTCGQALDNSTEIQMDKRHNALMRYGRLFKLSKGEFLLLAFLLQKSPQFMSYGDIIEQVYNGLDDKRAVTAYVGQLRTKLTGADISIGCKSGFGYRALDERWGM